jgi:hypothetical protein
MTQNSPAEGDTGTIQNLIVSGIRLSAGLTLYGIGQLQKIFDAAIGDKGLPGAAQKLESTLTELSGSLESNMDETKREALRSVSRVSAKVAAKTFQALSPDAILDAGNRLLGRRDDAPADPTSASASLAVDVLSAPAAE